MPAADPALSSRIFISYRREDTAGHVLALIPRLRQHFGAERVFKDTDSIAPGHDFIATIKRELDSCSILLAIIGKSWLTIEDTRMNRRRLDDPDDFLRLEVGTALKNEKILVIPVLVGRAAMPPLEHLPPDLADLARRNAIELSDIRWDSDVERLIGALEKVLGRPSQDAPPETRASRLSGAEPGAGAYLEPGHTKRVDRMRVWRNAAAIVAALIIAAAAAYVLWPKTSRDASTETAKPSPASSAMNDSAMTRPGTRTSSDTTLTSPTGKAAPPPTSGTVVGAPRKAADKTSAPTRPRAPSPQAPNAGSAVLSAEDRAAIQEQISSLVAQLSTGNVANLRALYLVPNEDELAVWENLLRRESPREVRITGKPKVSLAGNDRAVATFDIVLVTARGNQPFTVSSELARKVGRWRFISVGL